MFALGKDHKEQKLTKTELLLPHSVAGGLSPGTLSVLSITGRKGVSRSAVILQLAVEVPKEE